MNGDKTMKNKRTILIAGLLVAILAVGVIGAARAFAQSPLTTVFHGRGPGDGHGLGQVELDAAAKALGMTSTELSTALQSGKTLEQIATDKGVDINAVMQAIQAVRPLMLRPTELAAAAKALNMTTNDLSTAFKSGKTLAQVASDQKVDLKTVQDAIKVARTDDMRTQIKQAVTDGKITQAKADWLLEGLDKGFLDEPGFGPGFDGFCFGGPHGGHGFGNGPLAQPTQQSNP